MSTPDDFIIRPATAADAPTILAFIRLLAEYEKLAHEVTATPEQLRAQLFGAKPAAEVVLACEAERPVGFALYFTNFSTFLAKPGIYLEDVFVLPEARGKGYGRALLIHLARLAVERGCGRFEWAVLDWNQPALDFYRSLGAEPLSEWTGQRVTGKALTDLAARDLF
jgi:GNAT superfamily N-acetyltransferase